MSAEVYCETKQPQWNSLSFSFSASQLLSDNKTEKDLSLPLL